MSADDVAAWTDPVPSLAELGAVHFVGIGGAGMSGIARILLARGVRVSGSDRRDTPTLLALRALGARVERRARPGAPRATPTRSWSPPPSAPDNPELVDRARARAAGAAPGGRAGRGHGRAAQRRRRRHARQDLDHVDADRRRAGLRRRPVVRDRRRPQRVGQQRARGRGRRLRRRGRRERPVLPAARARSARSSPTSRPTTSTTTATSPRSRRPSTGSSTTVDPKGFVVVCADDPGAARLRGVPTPARLRTYGRGGGRRPAADRPRGRPGRHQLHRRPRRRGPRPGADPGARRAHGAQQRRGAARRARAGPAGRRS